MPHWGSMSLINNNSLFGGNNFFFLLLWVQPFLLRKRLSCYKIPEKLANCSFLSYSFCHSSLLWEKRQMEGTGSFWSILAPALDTTLGRPLNNTCRLVTEDVFSNFKTRLDDHENWTAAGMPHSSWIHVAVIKIHLSPAKHRYVSQKQAGSDSVREALSGLICWMPGWNHLQTGSQVAWEAFWTGLSLWGTGLYDATVNMS